MSTADADRVQRAVELFRASRSVLFITGAGLSADSGLPTYRGAGGLYENRDTDENVPIEVVMSGRALESSPDLTWKYLIQIEQACRNALPNRGHEVIAEMEARFDRVWVLTQNVDGLHTRAGSRNVIEIHGNIHRIRCAGCPHTRIVEDYTGFTIPPRCSACGAALRPDVVLFGERLPTRQLAAYRAETATGFDLVVSVGTRSTFSYISAPVLDAYHFGKPSIEINPGETDVTEFVTVKIPLGAAAALDMIWNAYTG
jgi:NAD-dependent deacetylase